jgi:RHS repeat-associated protein
LKRLTKVEEEYAFGSFAVTAYQYDEIGHLTSVTDAENHTTTYTYGSLFGVTKVMYPDSEYEEYAYDDMGNITSFTDCKGNEITYTYDDIHRLTHVQYQDQSISFTYDLNSNRTRMDDNAPNEGDYAEYTYDYWNRLTSEIRHIGQNTYTLSYQYDTANRLATVTYPDSMKVLYSYDDLNRITEIKRYIDGVNDEILMENVQYNTESLLTQFEYGNNLQATFSYDSRDRLSTVAVKNGATSFLDLDYTYDNTSNVTQLVNGWRDTSLNWHSQTESYSYDGLNRLTSASCASWSHTYAYDNVGNRIAKDGITYTLNSVNEVTSLSDGTTFTYDDSGNRTQKTKGLDTWMYTYDYANRLTKVEKNSESVGEYVYGGDGKRIQVTENNETFTYIYSGLGVLYEENSSGTAVYIYGPIGRLAKRTAIQGETHTYYYHTDHLGSTRLITDENKTIVTAAGYHPFGETSAEEGSEDYLFAGGKRDATGLYSYGARYYDPDLGRFITRDPLKGTIVNPQSLNRYTYCFNNPLKFVDPLGLAATFSDEEAQKAHEEQTGGGTEEEAPTEPDPNEYWDIISLESEIYWMGDVGVALASRTTATRNLQNQKTVYGLMIFYYKDGEIVDQKFIPLDEYWNLKTKDKVFDEIKDFLKEHKINIEDFEIALKGLEEEMYKKAEKYSNYSFLGGLGAGGLASLASTGWGLVFAALVGFIGLAESAEYMDIAAFIRGLVDLCEKEKKVPN